MFRRKCTIIALSIMLIAISLAPGISAISIKKTTEDEEVKNKESSCSFGKIEGKVMYAPLWTFSFPLPLATVKIGFQVDITKADGYYCMDGLKLNKEYTIIYSHPLYKTKMFPIILTEDNPEIELNLYFYDEDEKESVNKNKETKLYTKKESCEFGSVSGSIIIHCFPPPEYISGAKLSLEGDYLTRTTFSGLLGNYRFNAVPVGRQYTLTVTHPKFKSQTKTFTLLADDPDIRISFSLMGKDEVISNLDNEKSSCGGTIYGYTGDHFDTWGSTPVPLALVDAGVKKTISGFPMGSYRLTDLPLNQELIVTASKSGYKSDTLKVTLTELKPSYYYCFDLKEKEDDSVLIKEKTSCVGTVTGQVVWVTGGYSGAVIPFASVKLDTGRTKLCNAIGWYMFTGLEFDRTYELTADASGYDSQILSVTLTEENPHQELYFYLEKNDDDTVKTKVKINNEKGKIYGTVFGEIGGFQKDLAFADIEIVGLEKKNCGIFGGFEFKDLELGKTYTLIADAHGFDPQTKTVTLTQEKPEEDLYFVLDQNIDEGVKQKTNAETKCIGSIEGKTEGLAEYYCAPPPVPFAKITCEYGCTRSSFGGIYKLRGLPLNTEIEVIASQKGFIDDVKTVILTEEKPHRTNFDFTLLDDPDYEPKNKETNCIGHIQGRVGNSKGLYYWEPYIFAKVDAGVKETKTNLLGYFNLFLPLNQEYEITVYKSGFKPMTKTLTLTTECSYRELTFDFFESEPDEDISYKNQIYLKRIIQRLLSFITMSSNTRSNLLSTAAFMS